MPFVIKENFKSLDDWTLAEETGVVYAKKKTAYLDSRATQKDGCGASHVWKFVPKAGVKVLTSFQMLDNSGPHFLIKENAILDIDAAGIHVAENHATGKIEFIERTDPYLPATPFTLIGETSTGISANTYYDITIVFSDVGGQIKADCYVEGVQTSGLEHLGQSTVSLNNKEMYIQFSNLLTKSAHPQASFDYVMLWLPPSQVSEFHTLNNL